MGAVLSVRRGPSLLVLLLLAPAAQRLAAQEARYQSAHFTLHAPRGVEISRMLEELESAYRDLRSYGFSLPRMVTARCYPSTAEFTRRSGGRSFHLAMAVGERLHLQPLPVLLRNGGLARSLRHELVHVALAPAAVRGLPRWLNEGMAMIVAGERHPEVTRFRTLRALEDSLLRSVSHDLLRSAYGTSARLAGRVVERLGKEKTLALLRTVAARGDFDRAFRASTGITLKEWERTELGG